MKNQQGVNAVPASRRSGSTFWRRPCNSGIPAILVLIFLTNSDVLSRQKLPVLSAVQTDEKSALIPYSDKLVTFGAVSGLANNKDSKFGSMLHDGRYRPFKIKVDSTFL